MVLTGGGPSELVGHPLEDLVSLRGGGCQVVKMGVEIVGQFCALRENTVSLWNRAGLVAGTMLWTSFTASASPNESSPLVKRVLYSRFLWMGLNVFFQAFHV